MSFHHVSNRVFLQLIVENTTNHVCYSVYGSSICSVFNIIYILLVLAFKNHCIHTYKHKLKALIVTLEFRFDMLLGMKLDRLVALLVRETQTHRHCSLHNHVSKRYLCRLNGKMWNLITTNVSLPVNVSFANFKLATLS